MADFLVLKGSTINVVRDGVEWMGDYYKPHTTAHDNIFMIEELCIDPTGISRHAAVPSGVTIGSAWAKAGWYGFRRDGYIALVKWTDVHPDGEM